MEFWLKEQSVENKNKIAVTDGKYTLTYNQLYSVAYQLSKKLLSLDESRVGLYIGNDIESIILVHACWLVQIEIAMTNTRLATAEMTNQMDSVNVQLTLTTKEFDLHSHQVLSFNQLSDYPDTPNHKQFDIHRIASIMFTSGTTRPQKAAPQTFKNHYANALGRKESLRFDQQTIWLPVLPIYHISGLSVILHTTIEGFTVRLLNKYNIEDMLTIIKNEHPTHVSFVPQTLKWLMDAGLNKPCSIEKILLGGAKLSPTLIQQTLNYQLPICNSFRMTETCSQFLTASSDMLAKRCDTVGKPSDNVEVCTKQPNEEGHGELLIKGDNVMNGCLYPKGLDSTFEEGFFKTGDIAEVDSDGLVMVYDRRKDLIISSGENIYPYEIETVAKTFNGIIDAVYVPKKDDTWGQILAPYYVTSKTIEIKDLIDFLQEHLAEYKVPKIYQHVNALPYTSTGKLQRNKVGTEDH